MLPDTILARMAQVFTERLARDVPAVDVDLFESGLLDSLSFADLLVGLEEEFGIRIPLEDIDVDRFRTLHALADVVTCASAAAVPAPVAPAP